MKTQRSFRRSHQMLCPWCVEHLHLRTASVGMWSLPIYLAFYLIDPKNFPPALLNLGFIYFWMCLSIIPHELGHAIAGWICGGRVFRICIGAGRRCFRFRLPGTMAMVEFRPLLLRGFVLNCDPASQYQRIRRTLLYAGGPLANVALMLIAASRFDIRQIVTIFSTSITIAVQLFCANLLLLFGNLTPYYRKWGVVKIPNDGLGIYRSIRGIGFGTERERALTYILLTAQAELQRGRTVLAREEIESALRSHGDNATLQLLAAAMEVQCGNLDVAERYARAVTQREQLDIATRASALVLTAWILLLTDRPELMEEAERILNVAREFQPWHASLPMLDGAAQALQGNTENAQLLLRVALRRADEPSIRATIFGLLSINELQRKNIAKGRKYFAKARRIDRACEVLPLVERRIAVASTASYSTTT